MEINHNPRCYIAIWIIAFLFISCSEEKTIYFNGEVKYEYTYESADIDLDSIISIRPQSSIFKFDVHNYKSQFINTDQDTLSYYYLSQQNLGIAHNQKVDDWRCEQYGLQTDSVLTFQIYDTKERVLGYPCKVLEYKSRYATNKYYVTSAIQISPDTYIRHLAYNWKFYGKQTTGSLILKIEHQFKDYTMKGIATDLITYDEYKPVHEIRPEVLLSKCELN